MNRAAEAKAADAKEEAALEIRFGPLDLAQVRLRTADPGAIVDELTGRVATAPRFFERAAVGIDLGQLRTQPSAADVRAIVDAVRRAGMLPIGLVSGPQDIDALARAVEMPVLAQFRASARPPPVVQAAEPTAAAAAPASSPEPAPAAAPAAPESGRPALQHHQPVRSGQRVHARHRDLIVTASVGAGAEVMADGCVHIYGALRGRVMAGAHGDTEARVYCQAFYAELVSIAGVFRIFETLPAELAGHPVQAWLEGEALHFARIQT